MLGCGTLLNFVSTSAVRTFAVIGPGNLGLGSNLLTSHLTHMTCLIAANYHELGPGRAEVLHHSFGTREIF